MNRWQPEPKSEWDLVPSEDRPNEFSHQRLRHLDRVRRVVELVRRHEYVVILGPAYSDKTYLMYDVDAALSMDDPSDSVYELQALAHDPFTSIYINLWRVRTDNEATFFSSLAQTVLRSERMSSAPAAGAAAAARLAEEGVFDAPSFRQFLDALLQQHDRHLVR